MSELSELIGQTLISVERFGNDFVEFRSASGKSWEMYYEQDCCAECSIEDITGDLQDLVGSPILMAEESTNESEKPNTYGDTQTWTFYKLATLKGYVTIRWYGSSNGYYSEHASFREMGPVSKREYLDQARARYLAMTTRNKT
jgi:hypothetical protein